MNNYIVQSFVALLFGSLSACAVVAAEPTAEPVRLPLVKVAPEESGLTHVINSEPERGKLDYPWMSPPIDFDGDGQLDLIVYGHHGGGAAIWLGRGNAKFVLDEGPYARRWLFGARDPVWWAGGNAPHAIGTEGSNISGYFFLNDGAGNYRKSAQQLPQAGYGDFQLADLDGDGLHREAYMSGAGAALRLTPSPDQWPTAADAKLKSETLWESESLVGWPAGIEHGRGPGRPGYRDAYAVDLDGDERNELIVHFRGEGFYSSQLFTWILVRKESKDGSSWQDATAAFGLPASATAWLFPEDLDVDGDLDLVDLHSGRWHANDGRGKFAQQEQLVFDPEKRGLPNRRGHPWTTDNELQWLDLDNNGYRDLVTASDHGTQHGAFLNLGGGRFVEVDGILGGRRNRKFGDVDNYGRLDMATFDGKQLTLHRNQTAASGLHVKLVPKAAGDVHLGAKLWVYQPGKLGDAKSLVHYRQGFMERSAGRSTVLVPRLHIGLGEFKTVDVRVRFPSGVVREISGASAGSEVVLYETKKL
ncbi:CRTAC1 family protein [Anatilimnocola aggregata]|nr:CRTAC1 family protein [Anatilimnocola aggregata]